MLLRILLPLLILLLLPAWGTDRYLRSRSCRKLWRRLALVPPAVLSILLIATSINESYSSLADHWKGLLLSITLAWAIPAALIALFLLLARGVERWSGRAAKGVRWAGAAVALVVFLGLGYGFTLGFRHLVVKKVEFASPDVPAAFSGYTIVQLSDLHLGTLAGHPAVVDAIVDSVNAQHPDLICFTGDLVNYHADELRQFEPTLRRLRARDGVVSIMGNHDYACYFRFATSADSLADIHRLQNRERAMGWRLLLNENIVVHRAADSIAIVGVENDGRPPFPALADLPRAQKGLKPTCFRILLSHDPTHWRRAVVPTTSIPLTLSGHTHGMQFRIGSFSPAAWFYSEWGGLYTATSGQKLHVSLGVGEVLLPFRFGAWPEINVITLRRK